MLRALTLRKLISPARQGIKSILWLLFLTECFEHIFALARNQIYRTFERKKASYHLMSVYSKLMIVILSIQIKVRL